MREWKMLEGTRHQMIWVENAGLENTAPSIVTPRVATSCLDDTEIQHLELK